ncbi:MAG: hypothetical protein HY864_03600 [Chloroflexi bacterium]|nr:hypothetical protein [Chloroflexota bacterium]
MSETAVPPKRSTGLLIWMIVSQLLAVGSLAIWLVVAGLSFMAFDAGETPAAWAFVTVVWSYPIIPLGLSIGGWVAYAKRKNKLAVVLSGLSFAPPILFGGLIGIANLIP